MASTIQQGGGDIDVTDICRFSAYCGDGQQVGIFGLSFRCTAVAAGPVAFGELAQYIWDTAIKTDLQALTTTGVRLLGCKVAHLNGVPPKLPGIVTDTISGTITGSITPSQVSGIGTWQTLQAGRGYRGRSYVPFPAASDVDTDYTPKAAYVTRLLTLLTDMFGTMSANPFVGALGQAVINPVLYHRATGGFTNVTNFVARKRWATQRRRGDYGRINPQIVS